MPIESADITTMSATRFVLTSVLSVFVLATVIGCETPEIDFGAPPVRVEKDHQGNGPVASEGNLVTVDYDIFLPDGTAVLSDRGFRFELGAGAVISGIDEGVEGMRVGGKRTIQCPPHRHWGRQGYGDGLIPPNTVLTIELSLTGVENTTSTVQR